MMKGKKSCLRACAKFMAHFFHEWDDEMDSLLLDWFFFYSLVFEGLRKKLLYLQRGECSTERLSHQVWATSPSSVGSRVLFTVPFFLPFLAPLDLELGKIPLLAPMIWRSVSLLKPKPVCSGQHNEHDKSFFSAGANPYFSCFPRKCPERLCVKDKPKVDTGSLQRNFWTEYRQSGSHQPSSLFIPLSTTRCSTHSAKAGDRLRLPGLQELLSVCPVIVSEVL